MTVTVARMGRRKQHCPQKTGVQAGSAADDVEENGQEGGPNGGPDEKQGGSSDAGSVSSEKESMPNLEEPEPSRPKPETLEDSLNMLKNNPLLNPALNPALLSLNPSQLYALQLAQIQAAQLLSQRTEEGSRKRKHEEESVLNLSKRSQSPHPNSPLDLSGNKRDETPAKTPKLEDMAKLASSMPWAAAGAFPFLNPFLQSQVTPESFSKFPGLGGLGMPPTSVPSSTSASTVGSDKNPLERMSEIAKGNPLRPSLPPRHHSAWQSQWINRGPEGTKDIFKCVYCKDSFPSLQDLTTHMKETKHFGSAMPPSPVPSAASAMQPVRPPIKSPQLTPPIPTSMSHHASKSQRDILKEQLPMPRKLVRGQDVWLGRGEQQTKDILKCMWCGQSFRSLDLMTKHMQETKHYTKVISQEQIVSWKSNESQNSSQNHVNAVLTCKVCEQAFSSLKELSDHMVKNNHYKDHIKAVGRPGPSMPTGAASGSASASGATSPSQTKEKRKKSLPVRKLLELERAQAELTGQKRPNSLSDDEATPGRISCEKCGDKIPMHLFVEHIRQCLGPMPISRPSSSSQERPASSDPFRRTPTSSPATSDKPPTPGSGLKSPAGAEGGEKEEPKSILGSLEKMVQANFGNKKAAHHGHDAPSMSILQRLGIDEGIDYSKPLMDPMSLFRPHPALMRDPRSSSECSSPDRNLRADVSVKSESEAKSPEPKTPSSVKEEIKEEVEDDNVKEESPKSENHNGSPAGSPLSPPVNSNPATPKDGNDENGKAESPVAPVEKKNSHPLAALQLLCDKTEKTKKPPVTTSAMYGSPADPGAILAFSWACNQAVVNDSLLKCPFCDTPFISKGAYRHHLSKMHFVKDGSSPDPKMFMAAAAAAAAGGGGTPEKSPTPTGGEAKEENAQSKFQKYSQLAKQLSCSTQP